MIARSGFDAYTLFLLVIFFLVRTAGRMSGMVVLIILSYAVLAYAVFRFFSTNTLKRQVENAHFLSLFQSVIRWFRFRRTVMADKEHRYFKCPNCGQPLRVPRGKGKVQITCRACGAQFEEKC